MASLQNAVRDVVERARSGDQVAMGIIATARDNAKKGNAKALQSVRLMKDYIKRNPPRSIIGAEEAVSGTTNPKALQALWTCPLSQFPIVLVNASPFVQIWEAIACCVHKAIIQPTDQIAQAAKVQNSRLGNIVRKAILIQQLKNPEFPIARYCPVSAWEMGEI